MQDDKIRVALTIRRGIRVDGRAGGGGRRDRDGARCATSSAPTARTRSCATRPASAVSTSDSHRNWLVVDVQQHDMARFDHLPGGSAVRRPEPAGRVFVRNGTRHLRWEFMLLDGDDRAAYGLGDPAIWPGASSRTTCRPTRASWWRQTVYEFVPFLAGRQDALGVAPCWPATRRISCRRSSARACAPACATPTTSPGGSTSCCAASPHERLLDTVDAERQPQNEAVIRLAIELGKVLCQLDPQVAARARCDAQTGRAAAATGARVAE